MATLSERIEQPPAEPITEEDIKKNADAVEDESGSDKENPPADKETVKKVKKTSLRKRISRPFARKKKSEAATASTDEPVAEEEPAPTAGARRRRRRATGG